MSAQTIKVAAIQPALALGAVEDNLRRIEDLVRDAHREHAPDVITLPEAATSPNVYDRRMRGVARPVDGAPMVLLRQLARELDCVVGGGFLARRGGDVYGTYVVAEPDGRTHLHDKDVPTAWECNYYRGGDDDGVTRIERFGVPVGIANGWEWARHRTAARLRDGRVQLLLGGMCWPSFPLNWQGPAGWWGRREHDLQRMFARELPRQMARLIGAPVVMPSHVGDITFETPLMPGVPWRTCMVGETQICERDGTILARLTYEDGEGHVAAAVTLAPPEPLDPPSDRFWIPSMTASVWAAWHGMNNQGRLAYTARKLRRAHPWQAWPGGDVPDELGPATPARATAATTT